MDLSALSAVSPLDGRYGAKTEALRDIFSEFGLIKRRVFVEVKWLLHIARHPGLPEAPALTAAAERRLKRIAEGFSGADALRIKEIEANTNHDVKAVEYFIKEKIENQPQLQTLTEFVHFACTSEDINNLSHALMLHDGMHTALLPAVAELERKLTGMAHEHAAAMLSRTHGQTASPTTMGSKGSESLILSAFDLTPLIRGTGHRRHGRPRGSALVCGREKSARQRTHRGAGQPAHRPVQIIPADNRHSLGIRFRARIALALRRQNPLPPA